MGGGEVGAGGFSDITELSNVTLLFFTGGKVGTSSSSSLLSSMIFLLKGLVLLVAGLEGGGFGGGAFGGGEGGGEGEGEGEGGGNEAVLVGGGGGEGRGDGLGSISNGLSSSPNGSINVISVS